MLRLFSVFLFLSFSVHCYAADTLAVRKVNYMNGCYLAVDETGNAYVITNNNELIRYNEEGDSTNAYRTVQNGDIGFVDALNPLRILVYYPAYAKVVVLDRMMALKNELDLRKQNLFNTPALAASADGNIWVYDQFNARLKKINDQLEIVAQSNDLRQETQSVPTVSFLTERNWKVYMCDTTNGIYTFDRYGNYVNTLAIYKVKKLQILGSKLIYRVMDTLYAWDMEKVKAEALVLPHKDWNIIDAALVRNTLYVLYADRLVYYHLGN